MRLPFSPPLEPMLAKLARELPVGDEWLFEPKWDGFRTIGWMSRTARANAAWSRSSTSAPPTA